MNDDTSSSSCSSSSSSSSDDDFLEELFDDEDEDDEEDIALFSILLAWISDMEERAIRPRAAFYVCEQLEWERHVTKLLDEGPHAFSRMYRLDYDSFVKLCAMIEPILMQDLQKRNARWVRKRITTEIALHCLLRWLAGGSYLDIRLSAGISTPSFFRIVHLCMDAILLCPELAFAFPRP